MRSPSATRLPVVEPDAPSAERLASRGPGRKGWVVALSLAGVGLAAASAGITAVLMARQRPPPAFAPSRWEPGMGRPDFPGPPPPRGLPPPPPMSPPPPEPPEDVPAPGEAPLIPAERVAEIRGSGKKTFSLEARGAGLRPGMVLSIVETPTSEGLAKEVGTATVISTTPRRAVLRLDSALSGDPTTPHFVVLPPPRVPGRPSAHPESRAAGETPSAAPEVPAPAAPAEPAPVRQLGGRIRLEKLGPFAQKIILTNTDTVTWSNCLLVIRGRDVFKLGGMAPGGVREISLSDFERGGREVPFVVRDRLGLFCAEGQKEFPAQL